METSAHETSATYPVSEIAQNGGGPGTATQQSTKCNFMFMVPCNIIYSMK